MKEEDGVRVWALGGRERGREGGERVFFSGGAFKNEPIVLDLQDQLQFYGHFSFAKRPSCKQMGGCVGQGPPQNCVLLPSSV